MLSAEARPYIDASVPVLREHGLTITRRFYKNMFEEHPELTNLFNMGNQASGAQQQSLAAAVFAYAANIDNPDVLAPVVSRIVHKHASVGIAAKHYPIVGRHLLGAIQETLGDAASPELLSAWEEAYGMLADAFIAEERKLYQASGMEPGYEREMRVVSVKDESSEVRSFVLTSADGSELRSFAPGQYVSVSVNLPTGLRQLRQYSLSDAPGNNQVRISVKREAPGAETPAGVVSNWLHDHVKEDDILRVTPPFGDFMPDTESNEPIVLLSAGVGITPMISALNRIVQVNPGRKVVFAHAARSPEHHAHREDLARALQAMPSLQVDIFYESLPADEERAGVHEGRMQVSLLPDWAREQTKVYLCGPVPFMQAQWRDLVAQGVPPARIHREVFGPDLLDTLQ
ncbi:MAG TPA: NO-inducible flavohemoprotein [Pusillimonas sp.]|uniref:NO-inducible flavohemoprotein n=1 Tax=Pusillimonas sp. TaxID=3040095 RepID=UPI002BAA9043|nr:NO-inducible flavohemoprotein [Pusillimonas sp.]HUH87015.1 NO-inducible flavohemoprotein [Pusillimonas sp.]